MSFSNNAEGGSNGTTVTTGNSGGGSGDAWTLVTGPGTAGIVKFSSTQKMHGLLAYQLATRATVEQAMLAWDNGSGLTGSAYFRQYLYLTDLPPNSTRFIRIRAGNASSLVLCNIGLNTSGAVLLRNGQDSSTVWTGPTLSTATWYRVEVYIDATASAANSLVRVRVFAGDTTTEVASGDSGNVTVGNSGPASTNIQYVQFGQTIAVANVPTGSGFIYMDDFGAFRTDADGGWWGPASTNQFSRPSADSVDGNWLNESGTNTSLYASVNETPADDTDFIQSELAPATSAVRIKLSTVSSPGAGTRTFRWRAGKNETGGGTINAVAKLYQGGGNVAGAGTLKETFTHNDVDAVTTFSETVTATITDYSDLYVEFSANQV